MTDLAAILGAPGPVLAHQGGWDEMLMVGAPIAAFAALLWVANRRADTQGADDPTDDADALAASGAAPDHDDESFTSGAAIAETDPTHPRNDTQP